MPSLVVHQFDRTDAGVLHGPVLIGRVRACGVVVDSNDVSRVHAWIGQDPGGAYFVADTFSRTGTRVNKQPISARRNLEDGDEIQVASTRLIFRQTDDLPDDAGALELAEKVWAGDAPDVPIHFVCACGATIAVSSFFAGRAASCAYCQRRLVIPRSSGQVAGALKENENDLGACSICQCALATTDERTTCPGCGLSFHADCWHENKGCSAYGCAQVNALDPKSTSPLETPTVDEEKRSDDTPGAAENSPPRVPWLPLALGVGALALAAAGTVGYLLYVR